MPGPGSRVAWTLAGVRDDPQAQERMECVSLARCIMVQVYRGAGVSRAGCIASQVYHARCIKVQMYCGPGGCIAV